MEFGSSLLTHDAADALAALTARAAGVPTVMIHMVDGGLMRLAGGVRLPPGWDLSRRVPVSSTLAGAIVADQLPLIIEDVTSDARVPEKAPVREVGFLSYAGFPIREGDTVVGVCAAMDTCARRWRPTELSAVQEGARACAAFVEQRRSAATADRSRRFLDALLGSLQAGVAAVDADGSLVFTNPAIREMSGGLPEAAGLLAWTEQRLLAGADGPLPLTAAPLLRALRGERLRQVEVTVDRPGRRRHALLADAQPIRGEAGEVLGAVVAAQDVTERRRVERFHACEMEIARALTGATTVRQAAGPVLRAITGTLGLPHAGLWLVDEKARVLRPARAADAGEEFAGLAWRTGEAVWVPDAGADADDGDAGVIAARAAGVPGVRTALALPVPGSTGTLAVLTLFADVVEGSGEPLLELLRGPVAQIGQFLEHCRAQELELALARTREEYLALVGHELRTPLTSITAYADLLLELDAADFDAEGRGLVEVVRRNSDRLRVIVDELLDLSALDSGHATITRREFDLAGLVRDAVAEAAPGPGRPGPHVACWVPDRCLISADEGRLRQVVRILLSNAVLHTGPGGRVDVVLTPLPGVVELTVVDTGIGIPAPERSQVFNRFFRSTRTRERRIPGAGLGLAISRAIVERHGGGIHLLPGRGTGTRVQIRLPVPGDPPAPVVPSGERLPDPPVPDHTDLSFW
jgi:PAS domain S-box-containing protein